MRLIYSLLLLGFALNSSFAQTPQTADEILKLASAKAKTEHKNVFVKFTASWCGWCKKMDASMEDPTTKKFFDDNFVIVHLVVDENEANKSRENPGANAVRIKYNGDENQGIPFWFILDDKGKLLGDCYIRNKGEAPTEKGNNSGCPANEEEVKAFIDVLKKTTKLNEAELSIIYDRFRKNEVKRN
jgi:thiol-disulfide isomerase/thioredoxin